MKPLWQWVLFGLLSLVAVSALAFKIFQPVQVVPRVRLAPSFHLITQDGESLTSEDLRGTVVLYDFLYTRCPAPCYDLNATMQEIQSRLDEVLPADVAIKFVTISFDPQHDTPEVLQAYAESLGADTSQWIFATAENPDLLKTILGAGFEVYYQPQEDGSFQFDPHFVLVDGWGIIRGEYRYETLTPNTDRILRHIGVLADEIDNSKGAAELAYEAAHLFLCYAP
ncbi:MAG: SCO family protein [Anaerolineae bacterium]|nr:MAG: SCO family protein [Anaerolineae bacterium]